MKALIARNTTDLRAHWHAFWQQRQPRERQALALLAWVLLLALAGQTLWSMDQSRRALARQLPVLAAQAERMTALLHTWRQLAEIREAKGAPRPELLRQEIERRWPELGKGMNAQWMPNGELLLKGQTDFNLWLTWTAAMQEDNHLVLTRCRVTATSAGVEIDASLSPGQSIQ